MEDLARVPHYRVEDAANDWADWLENLILGRPLTPQEADQIMTKAKFWWFISTQPPDGFQDRLHSLN